MLAVKPDHKILTGCLNMDLTASLEEPTFSSDWLQSLLQRGSHHSPHRLRAVVLVAIVSIGKSLVFIFAKRKLASPNYGNKSSAQNFIKTTKFSWGSQGQGKTSFSRRADSCLHFNVQESSKSASLFLVVVN